MVGSGIEIAYLVIGGRSENVCEDEHWCGGLNRTESEVVMWDAATRVLTIGVVRGWRHGPPALLRHSPCSVFTPEMSR